MPGRKGLASVKMLTCRDVSTLISTSGVEDAPLMRRMGVFLHLAMCRYCRAFRRQLAAMGRAARTLNATYHAEPPSDFEAAILTRMHR